MNKSKKKRRITIVTTQLVASSSRVRCSMIRYGIINEGYKVVRHRSINLKTI